MFLVVCVLLFAGSGGRGSAGLEVSSGIRWFMVWGLIHCGQIVHGPGRIPLPSCGLVMG